jgi:2-hydroxy-6-oxonona-2,4-dienedioate hydrolase
VTAEDDLFGMLDIARYSARHIRGARLLVYPAGGHLLVGHTQAQARLLAGFLPVAR